MAALHTRLKKFNLFRYFGASSNNDLPSETGSNDDLPSEADSSASSSDWILIRNTGPSSDDIYMETANDDAAISDTASLDKVATDPTQYSEPEARNNVECMDDPRDPTSHSLIPTLEDLITNQLALIKIRHEEYRVKSVLADTGSKFSFLSRHKAVEWGVKLRPLFNRMELKTINGEGFESTEFADLTLSLPDLGVEEMEIRALIHSLPVDLDLLIGRDDMAKYDLLPRMMERTANGQERLVIGPSEDSTLSARARLVGAALPMRKKCELVARRNLPPLSANMLDSADKKEDAKKLQVSSADAAHLFKSRSKKPSTSSVSSAQLSDTFDQGSQTTSETAPSSTSQYSSHSSK
ncbi:hypothetical protein PG987_010328 [Apiospora arundinis]